MHYILKLGTVIGYFTAQCTTVVIHNMAVWFSACRCPRWCHHTSQ